MSEDRYAKYRKEPIKPSERVAVETGAETDEYVAFVAKDNRRRLHIIRAKDPSLAAGYAFLLNILYDDVGWTNFVLVFNFAMVMVYGKNLKSVVHAIAEDSAASIQEFDARRWKLPADKSQPFIDSIQVMVKQSGPPVSDEETSGELKRMAH